MTQRRRRLCEKRVAPARTREPLTSTLGFGCAIPGCDDAVEIFADDGVVGRVDDRGQRRRGINVESGHSAQINIKVKKETAVPTLAIIIASTRGGRAGVPVAEWFFGRAQRHGKFTVELIDLKQVNLPLLDEPHHPRFQKYEHEHTKHWSDRIQRTDAFVFVTPEYNYGPSPALLNALDYLYNEWNYKAAGFVSYGGMSGGLRSVQITKQVVSTLKMVPLVEAVAVPFFAKRIENNTFKSDDVLDKSATTLLDELARWNAALTVLRTPI